MTIPKHIIVVPECSCSDYQLYTLEKSTVEGVEVQEFDEEDDGAIER